MKPARFDYLAPDSIEEAVSLLAAHAPDARPLAGGQSLVPMMNFRLARPAVLVDLNRIRELAYVEDRGGHLAIGAMTRERTIENNGLVSQEAPLLHEATGRIAPLEVWSAHDVGKAINPMAVQGQIEGGVVQGLGYALCEEMVWDSGRLANPSLMDYKIPGAADAPPAIHTILIEDPDETGPFGAKGVGEPPLVGIAPAIANAVARASGVRLRRLPMTPERVLRAIGERGADG